MTMFDLITKNYHNLKYMNEKKAEVLRDLIEKYDAENILEIGFFHGKSSIYIGAILEDRGKGMLTTIDNGSAKKQDPNIDELLEQTGLRHRVQPVFAHRSFTWEMLKMIRNEPRPTFDLCYFDGGHTWDNTGFGFVLVNLLLRPGGIIVFDDLEWSIDKSSAFKQNPKLASRYSPDESAAPTVRLVWETLVLEFGYEHIQELPDLQWAIARKPA